jgi:hypothetical protein
MILNEALMTTAHHTVHISDDLYRDIRALATARGKSEMEIIQEAVQAYCKNSSMPSALVAAREAGIIGCASDLPSDLSTNPRHMNDFGK